MIVRVITARDALTQAFKEWTLPSPNRRFRELERGAAKTDCNKQVTLKIGISTKMSPVEVVRMLRKACVCNCMSRVLYLYSGCTRLIAPTFNLVFTLESFFFVTRVRIAS